MKANLIGILTLLAISGALLLRAEPARCDTCWRGYSCYGDALCGGCTCIFVNGPTNAGICG